MKAMLKVPHGKLIRVNLEIVEGTIREIRFTGDFFLHPEDSLNHLESALTDKPAQIPILKETILEFFEKTRCTLVGVQPESFVAVVEKAVTGGTV